MQDQIEYALGKGVEYVELNTVSLENTSINLSNQDIKDISFGTNENIGVRVLYKGSFATAFGSDPDLRKLVDKAIQKASTLEQNIRLPKMPPLKKSYTTKVIKNPKDFSPEEKVSFLKGFKPQEKIVNLSIRYADITKRHRFLNSEGRELSWNDTVSYFVVQAFAKEGDRFESYYDVLAHHGGYELMERAEKIVEDSMKTATEMLSADSAKGGSFPVVIDQRLGGVFIHEAVGHACEADIVQNGDSVLKDHLGEQIGSQCLSVHDNGSLQEWGWTPFDSEGVLGKDTKLIKNGRLQHYLHNRITAAAFSQEPTGNGRAQHLGTKAIPRMSNTYIRKGDSSFDEMISAITKGYYLKKSMGGQVDPSSGEFLFNSMEGFWIEKGEIKKRVKGASMVGNILRTLPNISLIGADLLFEGGGACGKSGQLVHTSEGSPHLKIDNITVGGAK